ncbi:MAG: bifunctional serine/threonine-protein kinase/formylglycine-generating enzyme family protein [Pyrinomonadaceae bacterium]|nr:SUMF1/EgtB/PvdO family nonheme iron enzyme [Pyrinomonadaceae bacterium]
MKECQLCKNCFADDVATCPHDGMPTSHTIAGEPVLEGKYHLECRIGQGGMGVVYKARHAFLKTQLAIKVILPDLVGNDPQLVTRFRQEALAAAAIRHQNVVGVTDYGVIDGSLPFLVMEYVEGESLHDLLAREKALSPERALELITAVCAGVGAAHHQGIVHRDLKPLNVMICSDKPNLSQAVKILDFGLAKIKSGELLGSFIQAQTTGLMGSPYYMAPEQWADEEPDARSDVYSLGVMFFQMVAGDVPFKGSSIPAIMKKHISDPAPTFADYGTRVSLELEKAVLHTLQKDKTQRTATVEQFVEELTAAIHPGAATIHSSVGRSLPVSSLKVITKPPQSRVFVDNISVGETQNDGALTLEGIQSGNHHLRISHNGFKDWFGDVVCDGKPQQVVAELQPGVTDSRSSIPMPADVTVSGSGRLDDSHFQATVVNDGMGQTAPHVYGTQSLPPKKSGKSAAILGILGVLALFLIVGGGIGAAYMMGVFGSKVGPGGNNAGTPTPSGTPVVAAKADLVAIPGGTFMMGSDSGLDLQKPAHSVTVQPFKMDKTEITNAEYYSFVTATSYPSDKLGHWINFKPIAGQENMPVRFVNMDDIKAFIEWRSKRDGVTYRLPTEEEWEFAARNGGKNNKYPWGDEFKKECAVVDRGNTETEIVGSNSCPNDWGVVDLIGNVFEWTGSKAALYPGSKGEMKPTKELIYMIRGGAAFTKSAGEFGITSMFRADVDATKRDKELGFRLVTQN